MSEQARRRLLKRLDQAVNDTACAPELGIVQYMILTTIWALTPRATLNEVIDFVYKENGDIMDVAQVFVIIQAFKKAATPLVKEVGKITTKKGRRPSACFSITHEGKTAVRQTEQHLHRVLEFGALAQRANVMVAQKEPDLPPPRPKKTKIPAEAGNT
ncbi:MAG: hypothetical protein ABL907_22765 [Hyphomicrobium sp.]